MSVVASRYARAFADVVAARRADPAQTIQSLENVAGLVRSSVQLRNVWRNPAVGRMEKLKLLDAIMSRLGGSVQLRNFVAVLIDQRRIGEIGEVTRLFKQELNQRLGIAEAQVTSARELGGEEKKLLERQIGAITGQVVQASYAQDAGLLGGAIVRVGSTIYDGSVRGQLQKIKRQIAAS